MCEEEKPSPETLRTFMELEWADLHHSRVQEWTALGVVAGVHVGLIQLVSFVVEKGAAAPYPLIVAASGIASAFAVFGMLITGRHRHLMNVKLHWIFRAEERLGLVGTDRLNGIIQRGETPTAGYSWKGLAWPRPFSTGGLLMGFYLLLILADILVAMTVRAG
jgi:hypothetical protein